MAQNTEGATQPEYPKGTLEYDAYQQALADELTKFVEQEPPYDNPTVPRRGAVRLAGFGQ